MSAAYGAFFAPAEDNITTTAKPRRNILFMAALRQLDDRTVADKNGSIGDVVTLSFSGAVLSAQGGAERAEGLARLLPTLDVLGPAAIEARVVTGQFLHRENASQALRFDLV